MKVERRVTQAADGNKICNGKLFTKKAWWFYKYLNEKKTRKQALIDQVLDILGIV